MTRHDRGCVASGDVSGALAVLPKLRRELLAPSLAQLTAADPLATCTALEHSPGLSCVTPLMVAHTMGSLAKPDVPVGTRTALLRYLQKRAIFSGSRDRVLHDLYVVLLILHPEEHELHRCAPPAWHHEICDPKTPRVLPYSLLSRIPRPTTRISIGKLFPPLQRWQPGQLDSLRNAHSAQTGTSQPPRNLETGTFCRYSTCAQPVQCFATCTENRVLPSVWQPLHWASSDRTTCTQPSVTLAQHAFT